MRITKKKLKKIIKEELDQLINEVDPRTLADNIKEKTRAAANKRLAKPPERFEARARTPLNPIEQYNINQAIEDAARAIEFGETDLGSEFIYPITWDQSPEYYEALEDWERTDQQQSPSRGALEGDPSIHLKPEYYEQHEITPLERIRRWKGIPAEPGAPSERKKAGEQSRQIAEQSHMKKNFESWNKFILNEEEKKSL